MPIRFASLDDEGYRRQTVTLNGTITSAAEGIFMTNGGRVILEPGSSIDAGNDIAILATGTVPAVEEDLSNPQNPIMAVPAVPPKLRVDFNLRGSKKIAEVLNGGWIINDGGETTIAVNNTVLHDGATGVTGHTAVNGIWDVVMLAEGVDMTDYSNEDPTMWTVTPRAANTIVSRDFSIADFTEEEARCPPGQSGFPNCRRPPPPPPPTCPEGQVGTPPDCMEPEPEPEPELVEVYAPRAALCEALPDFMMRMQEESSRPTAKGPGHRTCVGTRLGNASFTHYDIDISSDPRRRLKSGADATGYTLHPEAGSEQSWSPRAWLTHRHISIDSFTDIVGVRATFGDERRWDAGLGIRPQTRAFTAILDLEHSLSDIDTRTLASGHTLNTRGSDTRLKVGVGRAFEIGPLLVNAQVSAKEELSTSPAEYSGALNVRMR